MNLAYWLARKYLLCLLEEYGLMDLLYFLKNLLFLQIVIDCIHT